MKNYNSLNSNKAYPKRIGALLAGGALVLSGCSTFEQDPTERAVEEAIGAPETFTAPFYSGVYTNTGEIKEIVLEQLKDKNTDAIKGFVVGITVECSDTDGDEIDESGAGAVGKPYYEGEDRGEIALAMIAISSDGPNSDSEYALHYPGNERNEFPQQYSTVLDTVDEYNEVYKEIKDAELGILTEEDSQELIEIIDALNAAVSPEDQQAITDFGNASMDGAKFAYNNKPVLCSNYNEVA